MPKNSRRNRKNKNRGESSIMVPKEREGYAGGESVTTGAGSKFADKVEETNRQIAEAHAKRITKTLLKDMDPIPSPEKTAEMIKQIADDKMDSLMEKGAAAHKKRPFVEGGMPPEGLMAMPSEMPSEMPEEPTEDAPVDTYANATPEEIEAEQETDEVMEEDYIGFVLNEALVPEEQEYLMQVLEGDPQLSQIFDKVVETASEFTGAGEVTGPGSGISDSIPARLSDGEFVMTQKATEELGADNLQIMMDDAERAYDGGMMRKNRYLGGVMQGTEDELRLENESSTDDDIRKLMSIKANKTPSLR
tara:strand:- start:1521 stop:2435 length:915 start_codon:yes stop_codon:yes gene_type:complete